MKRGHEETNVTRTTLATQYLAVCLIVAAEEENEESYVGAVSSDYLESQKYTEAMNRLDKEEWTKAIKN